MANASGAAPQKKKSISYEKWGYFFIAPFIIVFIIFQLIPLFQTFYYSFFEKYTVVSTWEEVERFVGLQNYINIFAEGRIFRYLGNTMIMWVMGFVPQIIVSLLFGEDGSWLKINPDVLNTFTFFPFLPEFGSILSLETGEDSCLSFW